MTFDPIRITVLVDDEAGEGLLPEHGLSLWIETGGKHILFDMGQGNVLVENARRLGVPLEETDIVVLSHGHYDHSGGLANVLTIAPRAKILLHPGATIARYSLPGGTPARPIGMPQSARAAIDRVQADDIMWASEPVGLGSNIGVTGPIPRETPFEDVGGPFFLDSLGQDADPIVDDQALWLLSSEGLIVCLGCSHSGLVNSLTHVQRLAGNIPFRAVIGGFHLIHADQNRIDRTLEALQSMSPGLLAPCHCTGNRAIRTFKNRLENVAACCSGVVFLF